MATDRWESLKQLLDEAMELEPNRRSEFLERACGGDAELREEVEKLIRGSNQDTGWVQEAIGEAAERTLNGPQPSLEGRVLHYRIIERIGAGGSGIVYKAEDTRLSRHVVLKFLNPQAQEDPQAFERFQLEARAASALNHPSICVVHDIGTHDGQPFIVMEYLEGKTLKDYMASRRLAIKEVLDIGIQIVDALDAAHSHGLVHRDIKPANVFVRSDGRVKILDFGLAKRIQVADAAPVTREGQVMGTAQYMSPEQALGRDLDHRTDLFSFGIVLYEMIAGTPPFTGGTATQIVDEICHAEPQPLEEIRPDMPAAFGDITQKCLEKKPDLRYQSAKDLAVDLRRLLRDIDGDRVLPRKTTARRRRMPRIIFEAAAAVLLVAGVLYVRQPSPPEIRLDVTTPPTADPTAFAISPDGRRLVFSASREGKSQLWVRPLDSLTAEPLPGTEGAAYPFWSPDSASVGFFADDKLKRMDIVGGEPQALANSSIGRGGSWNRDGTILFSENRAILKVPAAGGEVVVVAERETGQTDHRFPQFLPDGRHFIYFVQGGSGQGIYIRSLDGGSSKRLASADSPAVFSPSGFLLFLRQTTLFAQAFDLKRQELSGNPFPLAENVAFEALTAAAGFSATSGIVAYRTSSAANARQLTWLDRSGKTIGAIGAPDSAGLNDVELAPDGKRVAVTRTVNRNTDVWLIDAARGAPTRLTFDPANDFRPLWSPDGTRVVFQSIRKGNMNLYWKLSSGVGPDELLLGSDLEPGPTDWSSDGRFLLLRSPDPQTGFDLWILPMSGANASPAGRSHQETSGDKKPFPFLKTPFVERDGQFSPDTKWIAYESNESGRFEIYVQPFPGPGGKFQISTNGGAQPRWNKNGKEILYVSLDSKMMAVPVKPSPEGHSLETGTPVALFLVRIAGGPTPGTNKQQYDVSADGQRFLVNLTAEDDLPSPITLIYNWKPTPK